MEGRVTRCDALRRNGLSRSKREAVASGSRGVSTDPDVAARTADRRYFWE